MYGNSETKRIFDIMHFLNKKHGYTIEGLEAGTSSPVARGDSRSFVIFIVVSRTTATIKVDSGICERRSLFQ